MKRVAVLAFAAGILLILGSCLSFAHGLWRGVTTQANEVLELPSGVATLTVDEIEGRASLAAAFELTLPADTGAALRPLSYSLTLVDVDGQMLDQRSGVLDPEHATVSRSGSALRLRQRLPVLTIGDGVRLRIVFDDAAHPEASRTVMLFYDPPVFAIGFVATLLLWVLGLLLVLAGAIQTIRDLAAVPVTPAANEATGHTLGIACHLSALAGYLLPMGHLLAPLWLWRAKRDRHREVEIEGRESLNFQLSVTVYALVAVLLSFVFVGLLMLGAIVAFHFCMTLFAARRVQRGEPANYPFTLRIIPASQ